MKTNVYDPYVSKEDFDQQAKELTELRWFRDRINQYVIPGQYDTQDAVFIALRDAEKINQELAEHYVRRNKELYEENKKFIDALEFYAAERNWCIRQTYDCDVAGVVDDSDVEWSDERRMNSGGKRAREALKEVTDEK